MRIHSKLLLAAALALVVFSALAATATAASVSLSPAGGITATSLGLLTFSASGAEARCTVTLRGELNRGLIGKVAGNEIGRITAAEIVTCSQNSGRVQTESLPWRINYQTILGTLPNAVTGVLFVLTNNGPTETRRSATSGIGFIVEVFGVQCLYRGPVGSLLAVTLREAEEGRGRGPAARYTTGLITTGSPASLSETPLFSGGFLCPSRGALVGRFSLTTQTLTRLPGA